VSPCSFCDYQALCRFDWQINDYRFLDAKGKLDVVAGAVTS
jgi:ATP-dependent helicase/DNAse subunit B